MQAMKPGKVIVYQNESGKEPFTDWLNGLRDKRGRRAILKRIGRLEQGLYGDCEPVGEGVSELRLFIGPGVQGVFWRTGWPWCCPLVRRR